VKAFNRLAEIAGEHLHKGSRIYLEGRKLTESWDDKQTGGKHYRDLIYADRIEFLDSKGNGNGYQGPARAAQDANVTDEEISF
jgi:single-strand DNA-binding protein